MEKKLEKALKKGLDKLLKGTLEHSYGMLSNNLLEQVKSREDFLYGIVVGDMLEGLGFCTYGAYKRYPKDSEFKDLINIIETRSKAIKEKIETIIS